MNSKFSSARPVKLFLTPDLLTMMHTCACTHKSVFVSACVSLVNLSVHNLIGCHCTAPFFFCLSVCVGGWFGGCVCVSQVLGWAPVCLRLLWIINTPLAADERVPARSVLTFRGPLSLRFNHAHTCPHSPHLQGASARRHDELVSLDRCTLPWHWMHAGSHLIYTASRGTEASLTSLIFPMPWSHTHTHCINTHTHVCKRTAVSDAKSAAFFLHSSFAHRLDQLFFRCTG